MGPDWLGNPQHVVAGAVLAFVVAQVTRAWVRPWWGRATVAVGAATTAEIVVELVEYLLLYQDDATVGILRYALRSGIFTVRWCCRDRSGPRFGPEPLLTHIRDLAAICDRPRSGVF
jgi:hypothetical protein